MAEIKRYGRPNERTVGNIGDIYTNTNTNEQFKCMDTYEIRTYDGVIKYYVWAPVKQNSGSGGNTTAQSSPAIIDVYELPTKNINENAFYRLMKGEMYFGIYGGNPMWVVHCVEGLPTTGKPVTANWQNLDVYYSKRNNEVYAYIDANLSAATDIPVGWDTLAQIAPRINLNYAGIVNNESKLIDDGSARVLIEYVKYEYKNGWRELPNVYAFTPEIDVRWDGDIGDRFTLDRSMIGYDEGVSLVKVSDEVPSRDQVVGGLLWDRHGNEMHIESDSIDDETFPGSFNFNTIMHVVYSQSELNASLGFPDGTVTNGIYFLLDTSDPNNPLYVSRFTTAAPISKLDPKFLPDEIGGDLYWDDIVTDYGYIRDSLDVYSKSEVYSRSEVDSLISNTIGNAIGGSY